MGSICHKLDYTQGKNFCQSFMKLFLSHFVILCKIPKEINISDIKLGLSVVGNVQMIVGKSSNAATSGGTGQET